VEEHFFPFRIASGVGPYYLLRDFVNRDPPPKVLPAAQQEYNQLRLDFSVSTTKDTTVGFSYP
jgi:hypothetical protein